MANGTGLSVGDIVGIIGVAVSEFAESGCSMTELTSHSHVSNTP